MSTFSASGIFSSRVDYFCLVCEFRLRDETEAAAHVANPVHTKNFLDTKYFENEQECIRKIKKWYLCELCNVLLVTAGGVRLHVAQARHAELRTGRVLSRRAGGVLAFASVKIDDNAWNGIINDTCAVCNTEFDDEHIHRNETNHILKLIQSKFEYDEHQNMFRKVDDSTFHCITCNKLVAYSSMEVHFNDNEHKNLYQSCCEQKELNLVENEHIMETEDIVSSVPIVHSENSEDEALDAINIASQDSAEIFNVVNGNSDEKSEINSENQQILNSIENIESVCSEDSDIQVGSMNDNDLEQELNKEVNDLETTQVTSDTELTEELPNGKTSPTATMKDKQKIKKNKTNKIKERLSTLEAKQFASENDMTYSDNDEKVYCNKCKVNIPTSVKCLQEHVAGSAHLKANRKHLEVALFNANESNNEPSDKVTAEDFIQSVVFMDGIFKCVVINDSICISLLSFSFMVEENNKVKCLICEKKMYTHDMDFHKNEYYHKTTVYRSFVLREIPGEFIREYKPQHFHCGYCNSLHTPWSAMLAHTRSEDHRESRSAAHIRLQRLMPEIIKHNRKQQFNRMMHAFGFMFTATRRNNYDSDSD